MKRGDNERATSSHATQSSVSRDSCTIEKALTSSKLIDTISYVVGASVQAVDRIQG